MVEYNIIKLENSDLNNVTVKNISLDNKLDFFMLIDSNNKDYIGIIENKILDFIIDKISIGNTYKDFSLALERINTVLKIYNNDKKEDEKLNILLAVLNDKKLIFSNIWNPSVYLVKDTNETIEITDKNDNKIEFSYISEWKLEHNDILILSTTRLLDYLSYSDFSDSVYLSKIEKISKNIELILSSENINKSIGLLNLKYINEKLSLERNSVLKEKISKISFKLMDNIFIKIIFAYFKIIKDYIEKKSKLVKNILLILWITVATVFLYTILSWVVQTTVQTDNTIKNNQLLEEAIKFKIIATDNYSNPEKFNSNIHRSEEIILELREKELFLDDLKRLEEQLNLIKKTFNWIETFKEDNKDALYKIPTKYKNELVKILKVNGKIYIITKRNIIGPIWEGVEPKITIFNDLKEDEYIDVSLLWTSLILLTKNWKIIEYTNAGTYLFKDVLNQDTWENSSFISNYAQNIYLVNKERNQIFKHKKTWNSFQKAEWYLKEEDTKKIWKIDNIAIDGGFYILKDDLSIVKFFNSPKYRFEKITLNKTPDSYKKDDLSEKAKIVARKDINYVYILLNNKIWIFKPNTRYVNSTKSLLYLWQIEASSSKIIDFYIEKDSQIIILNKNGLYNITFIENDWKILVNN